MPVLAPSEYDERYFFGNRFPDGGHPAGYSNYARWHRTDLNWPGGSLGEYYLDVAAQYVNFNSVQNKAALELGCALGLLIEDMRLDYGVDAWGVEADQGAGVSYARDQADPTIQPYIKVGNLVTTDLMDSPFDFARNQFDVIFGRGFLASLDPADVQAVLDNCDAAGKAFFFEVWDDASLANPTYYNLQALQWWEANYNWPRSTVLVSRSTGAEVRP